MLFSICSYGEKVKVGRKKKITTPAGRSVSLSDFDENAGPSRRHSDTESSEDSDLDLDLESGNDSSSEDVSDSISEDVDAGEVDGHENLDESGIPLPVLSNLIVSGIDLGNLIFHLYLYRGYLTMADRDWCILFGTI